MQNNATTDSYDSSFGNYDRWGSNRYENGSVCSGGPITLSSGADVFGDLQGSSVNQVPGSGTTISGSVLQTPLPNKYDPIEFANIGSNDNNIIERGPTWAPPFYDSTNRDLVVNNGRQITLQAGTYHFRNMLLAGGSTLRINGDVEIFIEGEMRFDNGTVANLTQNPETFRLNVGAGPVNIQGGHHLHAVIYAPEAEVKIENGSGFFGSIIGRTLQFAGGGGLHYDETLGENAPQTGPPKLVY